MRHFPCDVLQRMKAGHSADEDWSAIQARLRRRYVCRALFGAIAICVAGWLVLTKGAQPTQSDIDTKALHVRKKAQPFRPAYPLDAVVLSTIDMARVHGQLLPTWIMSLQHHPYSIGRLDAERAFRSLHDEAGKDPNLGFLLNQLHEQLMAGTFDFYGELQALFKGWNDYLAQAGVPFRLEHHVERTQRGPVVHVRSYRIVAEVPVFDQLSNRRVLLLTRQDRTNLVEAFLGQTSAERGTALVITDRVAEYAIEQLWPLFAPHDSTREPELVDRVRSEAAQALGEPVAEILARTYAVHHTLKTAVSSLANRRGCGSGVVIERVPWDGLSDRTLAMVHRVARKNETRGCTRLTPRDAERVDTISQELRGHPELEMALGTLAGWLTRAVATHESRHLADNESLPEDRTKAPCRDCPAWFDYTTRAEVAAYLASFASVGIGYVALFQACGNDVDRRGAHSTALEYILPKLLTSGCEGPIPHDLYTRAATLRALLTGRSEAVELPASLPGVVPIPHG